MAGKIRDYQGQQITVSYDVKRCIHAAECERGLPAVFDTEKRPWVQPDNASADEVAAVVLRCPTGALHFTRQDGGPAEPVPTENTITLEPNGPLYVRGNVQVVRQDGTVMVEDTRVALCRCGASANKPHCDGTHHKIGFTAEP